VKKHFFLFFLNTLAKLFSLLQPCIPALILGKAVPLLPAAQAGGREMSFPFSASSSGSLPQRVNKSPAASKKVLRKPWL